MIRCWADCLGDCSGKITGEHYISKCMWQGDEVKVVGSPWHAAEPRTIPLKAFVANILCEGHNSGLSEVDAEGGKFVNHLRMIRKIDTDRADFLKYGQWAGRFNIEAY